MNKTLSSSNSNSTISTEHNDRNQLLTSPKGRIKLRQSSPPQLGIIPSTSLNPVNLRGISVLGPEDNVSKVEKGVPPANSTDVVTNRVLPSQRPRSGSQTNIYTKESARLNNPIIPSSSLVPPHILAIYASSPPIPAPPPIPHVNSYELPTASALSKMKVIPKCGKAASVDGDTPAMRIAWNSGIGGKKRSSISPKNQADNPFRIILGTRSPIKQNIV